MATEFAWMQDNRYPNGLGSGDMDEIRAKHVFGELTFGDIWPVLVRKCSGIRIVKHEATATGWKSSESRLFSEWRLTDGGLQMEGHTPLPHLSFKSKVLVKEDHVKMEWGSEWIELNFLEFTPMEMKIL